MKDILWKCKYLTLLEKDGTEATVAGPTQVIGIGYIDTNEPANTATEGYRNPTFSVKRCNKKKIEEPPKEKEKLKYLES